MEKYYNEYIHQTIAGIKPLDAVAMVACKEHWNELAKPIHGLGKLEDIFMQIAGMKGDAKVSIRKKALIVLCADNGIVEEGVTQTDSSVTAVVANHFSTGATTSCIMAKRAGAEVIPVDIGVAGETKIRQEKVAWGTKNFAKEPAMTRDQAITGIEIGIKLVEECKEQGVEILATGEMGIGNTTTSSAVAAALLGTDAQKVTGKGAGLDSKGYIRKKEVIDSALITYGLHKKSDPVTILSCVGGLDIAGMVGVYIGAARYGIPVVMDGFISAVSALLASRFTSLVRSYVIPSHISKEPGMELVLQGLCMEANLNCNMKLGEGTGALSFMPLLDMAQDVYEQMSTFEDIKIEAYQPMGCDA